MFFVQRATKSIKLGNNQQLVQSLHRVMRVHLWMNLKPGFYNPNHCNLCYGLNTSMTFSLFELMAKTNLENF